MKYEIKISDLQKIHKKHKIKHKKGRAKGIKLGNQIALKVFKDRWVRCVYKKQIGIPKHLNKIFMDFLDCCNLTQLKKIEFFVLQRKVYLKHPELFNN